MMGEKNGKKKSEQKKRRKKEADEKLWWREQEKALPYQRIVRRRIFEVDRGKVTQKCCLRHNEISIIVILSIFH